jgi:DNA-binding transcriptional LysR family regulator
LAARASFGGWGSELVLVGGRLPSRHCQRLPENSKVQPEAPVAYVPQVRLDALLHEIDGRSLAAEAIHLSPPADAGFHVISKCVVCHDPLIFGVVGDRMRPRPNQRHAAAEHIEELRQLVDARSPQPATHVGDARIVAGGFPPFLAPVIAEYADLHPDVSVNLSMTECMVDMVGDGFDLAVRDTSVADLSLIARRVATYRFVVCGAPGYLKRRGTPKRPADLLEHNCLGCSHSAWGDEWRFAGPGGEQSVALAGNLQSNSANALRLAALHGQGLIMSPMFLVADEIKAGRLVAILEEFLREEHAINAIYPHRQHVPAKVRSFIDLLIRYFCEHPTWARPCNAQEIDRPPQLNAEQVIGTARRCATSAIAFSQVAS